MNKRGALELSLRRHPNCLLLYLKINDEIILYKNRVSQLKILKVKKYVKFIRVTRETIATDLLEEENTQK